MVENDSQHTAPMTVEVETLVVGAGPHALTVVAEWVLGRPDRAADICVVDPAGCWMQVWRDQFARQRIEHLRSPGVHHPDPDVMAFLQRHADMDAPPPALAPSTSNGVAVTCSGRLRRPPTSVFTDFCHELVARTGLDSCIRPGSVVELRPLDGAWGARLDDGQSVRAERVVWAGNPRRRVVPDGVRIGGRISHGADVDLSSVVPGERIAVLGGGQTAGQLALGAAVAGGDVVLASRAPTRVADLDVDAGWLMDDHLGPFHAIADPDERRRVVGEVLRGSMTADLADALGSSAVRWCPGAGELFAEPSGDEVRVGFAGLECSVDRCWAATGTVPDLRVDPALARLADAGLPHVDGWPVVNDRLEWSDGCVVVGALASLELGPAAGNLGGARAAAELLSDYVT